MATVRRGSSWCDMVHRYEGNACVRCSTLNELARKPVPTCTTKEEQIFSRRLAAASHQHHGDDNAIATQAARSGSSPLRPRGLPRHGAVALYESSCGSRRGRGAVPEVNILLENQQYVPSFESGRMPNGL